MAIQVKELQEWLEHFHPDCFIGVDEGGLCLTVEQSTGGSSLNPTIIEIGGFED